MLGALFGLTLSHVLTPDALASWGWRLPFLIGLLIAPVGYYIRRHLPEVCGVARGTSGATIGSTGFDSTRTMPLAGDSPAYSRKAARPATSS